ncbi:MAG: hypothetical protein ABFS34_01035 [Gemmatimonadota bacterium]
MSCLRAERWVLEARPAELAEAPEWVTRHVAECRACSAALSAARQAHGLLAASLERATPRLSADDAVRMALKGYSRSSRREAVEERGATRAPATRWWRVAPASLAALALAVLLWPSGSVAPPTGANLFGPPGQSADRPEAFAVEVAGGARVAVFQTHNPKIRVVWLYDGLRPTER